MQVQQNTWALVLVFIAASWPPRAFAEDVAGAFARAQSAGSEESAVVVHFRAAQQATLAGNLELAVEEYKKALQLDPTLVEARSNLGLAYHLLGQYDLAVAELSKALREKPNLLGANIVLGTDYLKLGMPSKAIPRLKQALRIDPSNREAHRALAASYMAQDNYREAAKEFRAASSLEADAAEAWYRLGQWYLEIAKRLGSRIAGKYPNSALANRLAGDLLAERDLWTDASVRYRKALALERGQPGLNSSLGVTYLHQAKLEEAEAAFRAELDADPENEQALLGLTEVALAKGDARAALKNISNIWARFPQFLGQQPEFPSRGFDPEKVNDLAAELEKAPETPAAHFILTGLYRIAGKTEKAREQWQTFQQLLGAWREESLNGKGRKTPRQLYEAHQYAACAGLLRSARSLDATSNLLLGKALFALGQNERASDAFAAALALQGGNLEALYWLVRVYEKLALSCFTRLVEEFPDTWRAHQFRGEFHEWHDAYKDAVKEYLLAARSHPDEPELHEALGEAYLLDRSFHLAEAELKKALQLDGTRARSFYLLGRVYLARHEERESIRSFRIALRYDPNLLPARANLGQAYMREGQAAQALPELEKAASLDYHGDLHHLLYLAYRRLGKNELARKALARSQELRQSSAATHQARVAEAIETLEK